MNNQNSILLIDPEFDTSISVNCSLLIRLGIDSFSYAILDKENNKISALFDEQECDDVAKKLRDCLKNDVHLSLAFKEIKLAIYTEDNVSIPNSLYNNNDRELNTLFFSESHSKTIYTSENPNFGFTSVFSFSKLTDEIISQSFANSKKFLQNAATLKLAENMPDNSLVLDFTAGAMYLLYLNQKQVVFQQGYEVENTEEFNYYLLLFINQLQLNLTDTQVYLSGIIHESDDKYVCLAEYFNRIQFLDVIVPKLNKHILEDMPAHYYTTLLALDQCV